MAQGQVRSPQAVSRLPQFQVAAYSLLLLASLLSSGFQRTADYLPRGVDAPMVNFDDFASTAPSPAGR